MLIYFHGVGVDIGDVLKVIAFMRSILGLNVIAVEYPGYGINFYKGICTEKQMKYDSYSVLDYIIKTTELKMNEIFVFGRSMGAGVALNLAYQMRHNPFNAVFLMSPFYSIKEVLKDQTCCFGAISQNKFDNSLIISEINTPLLIIHGQKDTLVPIDHSRRLY